MANLNEPVFKLPNLALHEALESSATVNDHAYTNTGPTTA